VKTRNKTISAIGWP